MRTPPDNKDHFVDVSPLLDGGEPYIYIEGTGDKAIVIALDRVPGFVAQVVMAAIHAAKKAGRRVT